MTKQRLFILLVVIILCTITLFAGSLPEDFFEDKAQLFFGEVLSFEDGSITVVPTEKIKGDVKIGIAASYDESTFVAKAGFLPEAGVTYLMAFYDANNPLYVFQISGTDLATMKLEGVDGINIWTRFQTYLNKGRYEEAEAKRVADLSEGDVPLEAPVAQNFTGAGRVVILIMAPALLVVLLAVLLFRRKK